MLSMDSVIAGYVNPHDRKRLLEKLEKNKIVKAFRAKDVIVRFPKLIEVDCDKCFDCGACYALCPVDAISYDQKYSVVFDEKKCIGSPCGLCVDACPARAIKLVEQNRRNRK